MSESTNHPCGDTDPRTELARLGQGVERLRAWLAGDPAPERLAEVFRELAICLLDGGSVGIFGDAKDFIEILFDEIFSTH